MPRVLVADGEASLRRHLADVLEARGYRVMTAAGVDEALVCAGEEMPDVAVLDLHLPGGEGRGAFRLLKEGNPWLEVVILSAFGDVPEAVDAMRNGAYDVLPKPPDIDALLCSLNGAMERGGLVRERMALQRHLLTDELEHGSAFSGFITKSRKMRQLFHYVEVLAGTPNPVLISGETGVGKELVARTLHGLSGRPGTFVVLNMGEAAGPLFSDVLFGHEKGAFTGASRRREGLLVQASDGTIFLDEIGDLDMPSQVRLLRVLQEREFYPAGSDRPCRTSARIVAATNRDLEAEMRRGAFRRDLYHRLSTHALRVPPLRERPEDIGPLFDHFVKLAAEAQGRPVPSCPPDLLGVLGSYAFPGNVRELRAIAEDAVASGPRGNLSASSLRKYVRAASGPVSGGGLLRPLPEDELHGLPTGIGNDRFPTLREAEEWLVAEALRREGGNQGRAAAALGISRQALNARCARIRKKQAQ